MAKFTINYYLILYFSSKSFDNAGYSNQHKIIKIHMNRITISRDNQKLDDIELTQGEFTIGRASESDLHLDQLNISGHHAKITTVLNSSHIEDLDSTNGTYVNDNLIHIHTLKNGDTITISDYQIQFSSDVQQAHTSDLQETMILDNNELANRLKESKSTAQVEPTKPSTSSVTQAAQKQVPDRPTPSMDELEVLRKTGEKPQKVEPQPTPNTGKPAPAGKIRADANKTSSTAKLTQRPVLHTSREELFKRTEQKKRLLSPVSVYIITVATICIVALLLLPYLAGIG